MAGISQSIRGALRLGRLVLWEGMISLWTGSGAPTDGTSGTGAGFANKGSAYMRTSTGKWYRNTGTMASPVWADETGQIGGAPGFTLGAEAADARIVTVQLKDVMGNNLAEKQLVRVWLSDAAGGAVTATAPSGAVVISTLGVLVASLVAKTHLLVMTNATGAFNLTLTEVGVVSWFVNMEYQGKVTSSAVLAFV